jgi:hypothetical protein
VPLSRTCDACAWNTTALNRTNATTGAWYLENVTSYDCPVVAAEWIGDGVCDDGAYLFPQSSFPLAWEPSGPANLDCPAYAHDGLDCCGKDARYHVTFNETAPACLTDARGPATCADRFGAPPPCWLTDAGGRTCEWLTSVLGGCDERLRDAKRPHVDVRACADACIFSNCTEDFAVDLVATYCESAPWP